MWGWLYLFLVAVRLHFALSPSYIHPDEHFQGPEIIAGEVFGYPIYRTWEFTTSHPVRSILPLWIFYGWPLTVFNWIREGFGYGPIQPLATFHALRTWMFLLSFVLGDWAVHELVPGLHEGRIAILLMSSSYVTWTYQTHTFSNSLETLLVLWCLVLSNRLQSSSRTSIRSSVGLAFLSVLGIFNRITFPVWVVIPCFQTLPGLLRKPFRLAVMLATGLLTFVVAVTLDTEFYAGTRPRIREMITSAVLTPWNNLVYNVDQTNLAQHGLHPFWQHFVVNLPQLVGPAFLLIFLSSRKGLLFWSAIFGIIVLSCFKHQEPRFLLPAVPLLLSAIKLPRNKSVARFMLIAWILFNASAGSLFGTYHQGGVISAQTWIAQRDDIGHALWWKTYSPPRWLLDGKADQVVTTDLMGMPGQRMVEIAQRNLSCSDHVAKTVLVAPTSAKLLDVYLQQDQESTFYLKELWTHHQHIGLDDLDFGDDGVWPTLQRVVGKRGLGIWEVKKRCM